MGSGSDIALVTQVVLTERQGRDRGWWEQMRAAYWPDSKVHLSWYDGDGAGFVTGSAAMAAHGDVALHRMFAPIVRVHGDRAHAEASTAMRLQVTVDGVAGDLTAYTRLNYRVERRGGDGAGEWRILSLDAVYEYATLTPAVPGQVIAVPEEQLRGYRSSYALLAWNVARAGRSFSEDELGEDRPEQLAHFYAGIQDWLDAAGTASLPQETS